MIVCNLQTRFHDGMFDEVGQLSQGDQSTNDQVTRRDVRLASKALLYKHPEWTCANHIRQSSGLQQIVVLLGWVGLLHPALFLGAVYVALLGLFTLLIAMRIALSLRGAAGRQVPRPAMFAMQSAWPKYSVLLPLYKEAGSLPKLADSLRRLDYPQDKLEVLFLVEQDDLETIAAVRNLAMPRNWKVLILPDGQPRTKPRALNVALGKLAGDIVTIYDAEDHPHPAQLKAAALALRGGGPGLACVQAPLRAYNAGSSWIAGQWGLEYDIHFGLILPALAKAKRPIALGGTSNHFRVSALREVSGWDAWNVTEDADLGLRLTRRGYRVGTIAPPTNEEAPESLRVWLPQRSRWIKGYMQSASVLWRKPIKAVGEMGFVAFSASQVLLLGAILSACLHGPLALLCLIAMLMPGWQLGAASFVLLLAGYLAHCLGVLMSPGRRGLRRIWLLVTAPLYWPLQSVAAIKALYELATTPYAWSKTPHALTETEIPSFQRVSARRSKQGSANAGSGTDTFRHGGPHSGWGLGQQEGGRTA